MGAVWRPTETRHPRVLAPNLEKEAMCNQTHLGTEQSPLHLPRLTQPEEALNPDRSTTVALDCMALLSVSQPHAFLAVPAVGIAEALQTAHVICKAEVQADYSLCEYQGNLAPAMPFQASQASLEDLWKIAQCGKNEAYLLTWALMLIVADWAHTFPLEVEHMWPAPLSWIKVLFFLNRYNVLDIALSYVHTTGASIPKQCKTVFFCASIWLVFSIAFAEAIMYMRVYALSGRSKVVLWILSTQFVLVHGGSIVLLAIFLVPLKYEQSPLPTLLPCSPVIEDDDILISIFFGIVMLSELLIFTYTLWIGYKKHRGSNRSNSLLVVFYRDGSMYFGALVLASAANLAILFTVLPTCRYMFNIPQRALHSILASRTVLHLKEMAAQRLIEYDSNGRPPMPGLFNHSGGSGSGKSNRQEYGESFVLSEFQAAGPARNIQSIDTFGHDTQLETAGYNLDGGAGKTRGIDAELYGYGGTPPEASKLVPLRRQRTPDWNDGASRETARSTTPLQGGLQVFVQRQQTRHL
ncbi:hypothetical protein NMY22_g715 [Coprinellus aureogranulatus]|nr:hypothetical protein NMY22_g715 [Coprinellus aureogranulatus]